MFTLSLELDNGKHCKPWFTATDSKNLCDYLLNEYIEKMGENLDIVGTLEEKLGIDLSPLGKLAAGDEYSLEDWLEEEMGTEEEWRKEADLNKAAWQSPQTLTTCLNTLIGALDQNPDLLGGMEISDPYVTDGDFKQDLIDLRKMVEWAKDNGATRVRITFA